MSEEKLIEGIICDRLNRKYVGNCKYKLANVFVFKRDWESDFFVQKDNGYSYEFEVKISRSDFLSDKKKVEKHLILENGRYQKKATESTYNYQTRMWDNQEIITDEEHTFRPNKFFYVVPEGMIKADEVPAYAGLMYVPIERHKDIVTVKDAPFIHKEKLSFESVLCNKFYHYWLSAKQELIYLKREFESLKKETTNK